MQKLKQEDALHAQRTAERLRRIAGITATNWGVRCEDVEAFPCRGERENLARIAAIGIAREILYVDLGTLALHFGADAEAMAASCNRAAEKSERNEDFRYTYRFLRTACAAMLDVDASPGCDSA